MKHVLGVAAALILLSACSHDDATKSGAPAQAAAAAAPGAAAPAAEGATTAGVAGACPATAAPTHLVTDPHVTSLQVVGDKIFYRSDKGLMRIGVDGSAPVTVFASTTLTHAWVEGDSLLVVESPEPPDAVVRVISLKAIADAEGLDNTTGTVALPTTWNAAGTHVFASDAKSFYLVADEANTGAAIYSLTHDDAPTLTAIAAATDAVLSSPQLTSDAIWFVRDSARVFRSDRAPANADDALPRTDAQTTKEVFAVPGAGAACRLLIAGARAICVQGSAIEQRDLKGGTPTPLFDLAKSQAPKAAFGNGIVASDAKTLVLHGADIVRTITLNDTGAPAEKVIACGRDSIAEVGVSGSTVVWAEKDGLWSAPR